ncbi:MAG: type II toxin-antitoxin system RelE/ParE family toxin [Caulobacteraceae bacterium]|nr:MAG: type II toxin-antitoxin system RelE/ParE family toxin [Caulobacteraceae bacterium]
MRTVVIEAKAARVLRKMPTNTARLIRQKIDQYAADPESLSANVVKLTERRGYRLRVGDWRVLFDEDGVVLTIFQIGSRGQVYR